MQVNFMSNKKPNFNTIKGRLKKARIDKGYRQEDLAKLLHISTKTYSTYERDEGKNIPMDILIDLSKTLDISIDVLLTGKPFPVNNLNADYAHLLHGKSDVEKAAGLKVLSVFFEAIASIPKRRMNCLNSLFR